ncbi:hypothetical protein [Nostoc sp.]|uniref:hypothetical protein n=1 Tax=Nostoc sp. TaxID=1180 RepID=UPI002FF9947A
MNQKVDLSSLALILEKILALIATHLNVEPVQLVLITTGELEEEFRSQNSGAEPETSESSGQNQLVGDSDSLL